MLSQWTLSVAGGSLVGFLAYCNLPVWMWFGHRTQKNYIDNINGASLSSLERKEDAPTLGQDLWKKHGAVVMAVRRPGWSLCRQEAAALTALKPLLSDVGIPLAAVLHEVPPAAAVEEFAQYFSGPLFHDTHHKFFGPLERRLGLAGMLRFSVYYRAWKAHQEGIKGNLDGDGTLLGGVYVIGPSDMGILYEHREGDFGDHFDREELLKAVQKIQQFK